MSDATPCTHCRKPLESPEMLSTVRGVLPFCNEDCLMCCGSICMHVDTEMRRLRAALEQALPWDDRPLPEDDAIRRAFPTRSGKHETYGEAMRLVGARHSKGALVALVNWLLVERDEWKRQRDGWQAEWEKLVGVAAQENNEARRLLGAALARAEAAERERDEFEAQLHGKESPVRTECRLLRAENGRLREALKSAIAIVREESAQWSRYGDTRTDTMAAIEFRKCADRWDEALAASQDAAAVHHTDQAAFRSGRLTERDAIMLDLRAEERRYKGEARAAIKAIADRLEAGRRHYLPRASDHEGSKGR